MRAGAPLNQAKSRLLQSKFILEEKYAKTELVQRGLSETKKPYSTTEEHSTSGETVQLQAMFCSLGSPRSDLGECAVLH